ncbi:MAG: hypothetical protein NVS9B15_11660 [Acidobacteriaceae bacterium]
MTKTPSIMCSRARLLDIANSKSAATGQNVRTGKIENGNRVEIGSAADVKDIRKGI